MGSHASLEGVESSAGPASFSDFEIMTKLGEGAAGTVYKARNRESGQVVAIKVMAPTTGAALAVKRFAREFVTARALNHPNIVHALDFNGDDPPFLVMEYVD